MKCIDEKIGRLITLYEFGELSRKDAKKFEAHLLECEFCLQSLKTMAPVVDLMQERKEEFLSMLSYVPQKRRFEKYLSIAKKKIISILSGLKTIPALVPALGVAIVAIVAVIFINREPGTPIRYSNLAHIEPIPYIPLNSRGNVDIALTDELIERGMRYYSDDQYLHAIASLDSAVQSAPKNMESQFYLGLNYLLAKQIKSAIDNFSIVIENSDNPYIEKSHWYLGNAYLLMEDRDKALIEFNKVVALDGIYKLKAEEISTKIDSLVKRKSR